VPTVRSAASVRSGSYYDPMSARGARTSTPQAWQRAETFDLSAGVVAILLLALIVLGLTGPVRLLLTAAFTFFVPGRAIVSNWSRMAGWSDIAMSIALSLGVLTLFAAVSLWARIWHPLGLFEIEAVASLIGLGVAIARRRSLASAQPDRVPPRPDPPYGSDPRPRPDPGSRPDPRPRPDPPYRPDPRPRPGPRPDPRSRPGPQSRPRPRY
jgi:hypothetical protein